MTPIQKLRNMTDEQSSDLYDDDDLQDILDTAEGSLQLAAAQVWREKAARYAALVDVSESGSSRSLGDLQDNALKMSEHYAGLVTTEETAAAASTSRVRSIVRT